MSKLEELSLKSNTIKTNRNENSENQKTKSLNKSSNKSKENKNQYTNSTNNNNNNNLSPPKDAVEINLSGQNLSTKEGQLLINKIITNNKNINKLILKNCNLTSLPKELLKLNKLTTLDICNNRFKNFNELIQDLSKLNNLVDLQLDLDNQNQVLIILSNLPKLNMLNEKPTKSSFSIVDVEYKDIEDISLSNNLDYYNEIVKYLNEKDKNNSFANKFQLKINEEGEKINNFLDQNIPNYIYANVTLKSQIELQKCLSEKYLEYLGKNEQYIGNYIFKMIFESADRLVNLINNLYPKIVEKTENLRNQIENAKKAAKELSDYEYTYNDMKNNKLVLETNLDLLQKKVNKLETENKFITEKLAKSTKNSAKNNEKLNFSYTINYTNQMLNKANTEANSKIIRNKQFNTFNPNNSYNQNNAVVNNNTSSEINNTNNNYINNISKLKKNKNPISKKVAKEIINELYISKENYDRACYENKLPSETMEQYMYIFLNNKYGLKNLVLDWASAIIDAIKIYGKEDCDINLFGKILKNEQEEGSRLVIIKLKESIASLMEYFYKLRNEYKPKNDVDKEMKEKKKGLLSEEEWKEIIHYIYNEKDAQIIEIKIINFIKEQNQKIFNLIENGEDLNKERLVTYETSNNINNNINDISTNNINNNNLLKNNYVKKLENNLTVLFLTDKKTVTREVISNINRLKEETNITYKDFVQLVCENQIQNREKYLKKFVELFKRFDKDEDGILDETQFIEMIKAIPYCQNNLEYFTEILLNKIDPFNHKKFIFSDCVNAFGTEIIEDYNMSQSNYSRGYSENENINIGLNIQNETTLLDKICLGN